MIKKNLVFNFWLRIFLKSLEFVLGFWVSIWLSKNFLSWENYSFLWSIIFLLVIGYFYHLFFSWFTDWFTTYHLRENQFLHIIEERNLIEEKRIFSLIKIDNLKVFFVDNKRVNIKGTLSISSDKTYLGINFITHCSLEYYSSKLVDRIEPLGFVIKDKKASPVWILFHAFLLVYFLMAFNFLLEEQKSRNFIDKITEKGSMIKNIFGEKEGFDPQLTRYLYRLENEPFPPNIKNHIRAEIVKIKNRGDNVLTHHAKERIEELMKFPWWQLKPIEQVDLKKVRRALDKNHYGLSEAKAEVIEHLALKEGQTKPILLVGPPGTGKTTFVKAISEALGEAGKVKFKKIVCAGAHDEGIIRGWSSVYTGAKPGEIVKALQQMNEENNNNKFAACLFFEEIDKISKGGNHGDPAAALAEVFDPEQNSNFEDRFLSVKIDLSGCFFIAAANSLDNIPFYLLNRFKIIKCPSYSLEEKIIIAQNHSIPSLNKKNGRNLNFSSDSLEKIIKSYLPYPEGGLRTLNNLIEKIFARVALEEAESGNKISNITIDSLEKYLGLPFYTDFIGNTSRIGVVNGLYATETGAGGIIRDEVVVLKGKGKFTLTGNIEKVTEESAKVALNHIKKNCIKFGIDYSLFEENDIQIHEFPGAPKKDGPSGGSAFFIALVSALTNKPVPHEIAATGELDLEGNICPVGGIKEKISAALQAGIKTVFIPKGNARDIRKLEEYNPEIKGKIEIVLVKNTYELFKHVF